jgi:hypothetical protein
MKILFVCHQYIHTTRWINQLKNTEHEIYVFDCLDMPIHKKLQWTNFITDWSKRKLPKIIGEYFLKKKTPRFFEKIESLLKVTASEKLIELIKEIKPDLVHSLEMQSQTYHVLKARQKIEFKWAYFSWGSDIYFYQHQKYHRKIMQKVFSKLDYLFVDNTRDIELAKNLGFKNEIGGVFPAGGGYTLALEEYQQFIKPINQRSLILIKGYHHWAGRAIQVLEALEFIIEEIGSFDIYVYSAHDIVIEKIKELNKKFNLEIEYSSRTNQIPQKELLEKFGNAKIAIGNSISDGIPNTLIEAIISGAFPIQSNPGNVTEDYIIDGDNGLLINNPEDSKEIAKLIKIALTNNELLVTAFEKNQKKTKELEYQLIKDKVLDRYRAIENQI